MRMMILACLLSLGVTGFGIVRVCRESTKLFGQTEELALLK